MRLYRFQPINKLTLQNLTSQKNWLANPFEFNDPFEFSFYDSILIDNDKDEYRILSQSEKTQAKKFKRKINKYGVVCYTSDCFSTLLWSHYAEQHKGMCLVFSISMSKNKTLHQVKYQEYFPEIELVNNSKTNKEIIKIVTTKSKEWKYEEEYREILPQKNTLHKYPGRLVEIIFGCRATFEDINMVSNIAFSKNDKIRISKMDIDKLSYGSSNVTSSNNKDFIQSLKESRKL